MTRKTLTFSAHMAEILNELNNEDCGLVLKSLIAEFFKGKSPSTNNYSESARLARACIAPELRKMESVYKNGLSNAKKIKERTKTGLLCSFLDSETTSNLQQIDSTLAHAHAYNNIPNLNNNYNNKYISNNQLTNNKYAQPCGEIEKNNNVTAENEPLSDEVQFYLDQVTERAEPLMQTEPKAANKLIEVAKYVTRVKNIKIQGQWMTAAEVLCKYVNIFRTPEPASKIASDLSIFFDSVASNIAKHEVKNASAYLAAALYLKASGLTA